jgi:hypothetical protein
MNIWDFKLHAVDHFILRYYYSTWIWHAKLNSISFHNDDSNQYGSRFRSSSGLKHRSDPAWMLGLRIRIPLRAELFVSCVCCVLGKQWSLRQADHSFRGALPVVRASSCKWAETSKMRWPRGTIVSLATLNKEVMQKRRFALLKSSATFWLNSLNTSSDRKTIFFWGGGFVIFSLVPDTWMLCTRVSTTA